MTPFDSERSTRYILRIYREFHRPEYISPDPLEIVRRYTDPGDREIAAVLASSLALGRVEQIIKAVDGLLSRFRTTVPGELADFVRKVSPRELEAVLAGFRYRFFDASHLFRLIRGIGILAERSGSLQAAFGGRAKAGPSRMFESLDNFAERLLAASPGDPGMLVSRPRNGSACKRFLLMLRWLVRRDAVDPGGWDSLDPSDLLMPVDTHILRIGQRLGLTTRTRADLDTAKEITSALRRIDPADPVRFDFSLSRVGIHPILRNRNLDLHKQE